MKLKVRADLCNDCRHCSDFFRGLPDKGFEEFTVPQWVIDDEDCMELILHMMKACEPRAITMRV